MTSGYAYVGATENTYKRFRKHKNELRRNNHFNNALQFAWNIFGEVNFKFTIIEVCIDGVDVFQKEAIYLKTHKGHLFNHHRKVGLRGVLTEEGRRKISEKAKAQLHAGHFANAKKPQWSAERRASQAARMLKIHKEGRTNHNIAWTDERREAQRQRMIERNRVKL